MAFLKAIYQVGSVVGSSPKAMDVAYATANSPQSFDPGCSCDFKSFSFDSALSWPQRFKSTCFVSLSSDTNIRSKTFTSLFCF